MNECPIAPLSKLFSHLTSLFTTQMQINYTKSEVTLRTCKNSQSDGHEAFSSCKISFLNQCILPTAEETNLLIMVTVTWSNRRGRPLTVIKSFVICLSN